MIFWILAILMVGAAVLCVLIPLSRKPGAAKSGLRAEFYENQLRELGLDDSESPDGARAEERAEIGRRLLEAQKDEDGSTSRTISGRKSLVAVSLGALIFIPAFTAVMYGTFGAPGFEETRIATENLPIEQQSIEQLINTAERQLDKNPDDLQGWTVLAAVYGRSGQFTKRARALSNILRLSGPEPQLLAELGEARTLANDGIVSEETVSMLREAVKTDPQNIKARAYLLLATEQEGNLKEALNGWRSLLVSAKGQEVWEGRISQRVTVLESRLGVPSQPGPDKEQVEQAARLDTSERQAMIEDMVSGLAQRLEGQPDDIEGWLRLLRSYHVLNRSEALQLAWRKSTSFFSDKEDETARLMAAIEELGYEVGDNGVLQPKVTQ